ncbi:MAG TPA: NlpC/P60 family protein [Acidimicrobiales bacterium]
MRRALLALALVLSCTLAVPAVPSAGADPIADKRAEAERISRELAAQGQRISELAEEYNEARLHADAVEARVTAATSALRTTNQRAVVVRGRLKEQAVESYMRGGALPALAMLVETKSTDDLARRREYVKAITGQLADALDALRAVRLSLEEQREELDRSRAEAKDALAAVETRRSEAQQVQRDHEELLAQVKGELADLVAAEARRRAEEEARRVQAELAARQARELAARQAREEAARRAAATTTTARPTASPSGTATPTTARRTTTTIAPAPTGNPPPPAAGADAAVAEAKRQIGKPYEWGADGPDSFDCSGLTQWSWRAGGKDLPHSSRAQWSATSRVAISDLRPGDLVFYGDPIHHVGIYVGDGQMVEASETGTPVRYASIYRRDLVGAGRVN